MTSLEVDVVVIGAGQAGLSASNVLTELGREHVVLERGQLAQSWRDRWDSFTLVGPNWSIQLRGQGYDGADPDGFMRRDEIVDFLSGYGRGFGAPVLEGVNVDRVSRSERGMLVETSSSTYRARDVVVATGSYPLQRRSAAVTQATDHVPVMDSGHYRSPEDTPAGRVLVVGSGQSGCQIAEELHLAGREVVVACGRTPWQPRRIGDHDLFWWLINTPFAWVTAAELPSPQARLAPFPQVTGKDGGHDLHYRTLHALGVQLVGHFTHVDSGTAVFADDIADSVAFGDERYALFSGMVREAAAAMGMTAPDLPSPESFAADPPTRLPLSGFGVVINAAGYTPDYARWVDIPQAFDDMGLPRQVDGSSTAVPGLHFLGAHFQRNRVSASLHGVGPDADALLPALMRPTP